MKQKYFDLAKKLSKKSDHNHYHIGSAIIKKNKVLGLGFNRARTHPRSPHPYQHLHSEIDALIGISFEQLKGSTIYNYRENKQGGLALARPCPSCMTSIKSSGIKYLCYTTYGNYKKENVS